MCILSQESQLWSSIIIKYRKISPAVFNYGLKFQSWSGMVREMGTENQHIANEPALFFKVHTDFMRKLSGGQALNDSWVRVKSFSHISPLVPSSPWEGALQSTRLWGLLKVTVCPDGFPLEIMVKLSLFKIPFSRTYMLLPEQWEYSKLLEG